MEELEAILSCRGGEREARLLASENLADLAGHPRYRFVRGDICDRDLVAVDREDDRRGVRGRASVLDCASPLALF